MNSHQDYITSVCRCGHEDHYSEYHFDDLDEQIEFNEALNATMKKLYSNLDRNRVLSQVNNAEQVNEIRECGYKIQQFDTTDGTHEFYKIDDEYMYLRANAVHGYTEVIQMVFKQA